MTTKKKIYIVIGALLGIFLIIGIVNYFRYQKLKKDLESGKTTGTGSSSTSGSGSSGSTSSGSGTGTGAGTPPPASTPPYYGTNANLWLPGDKLRTNEPVCNIYSGMAATTDTVAKTVNTSDTPIGIFKTKVGSWIQVQYVDTFFGFPSIYTGYIFNTSGSALKTYA